MCSTQRLVKIYNNCNNHSYSTLGWNILGSTQGWLYQVLPLHWSPVRQGRTQTWKHPKVELSSIFQKSGLICWPSGRPAHRKCQTQCQSHGEYQLKVDDLHNTWARTRRIVQDRAWNKDRKCLDPTVNNWPHPNQTSAAKSSPCWGCDVKLLRPGLGHSFWSFKPQRFSDSC